MEVNNRTKKVTRCGMLIGIAIILQYIEISIPIMPSFIKLDFSDLPELIGAFAYGKPYTKETEAEILDFLKNDFCKGLSLLGGDPFEFSNQEELVQLCKKAKELYPKKDIWAWTGFILDQDLLDGGRRHGPMTDELLSYIDVLVDGPFVEEKKNIQLAFRGSENQRVIDLKKSLAQNEIVLYLD